MPKHFKKIILLILLVILLGTGFATYLGANRTRDIMTSLMHKDSLSLANIFAEGARLIYEQQRYEIAQVRFRLEMYAMQIDRKKLSNRQLPMDVQLVAWLDENGEPQDTFGEIGPKTNQWIALLPQILAPIIEGNEQSLFFGLDPEFPVGVEPMGFARRLHDESIIVLFAERPFPSNVGIGLFARQLAETPSVRYIILQNRNGIMVASKDVFRATSIESDAFLKRVIEDNNPESRFISFEGEEIFELAYPFPTMGEFSGILRIGLPLSEYSEVSHIVWWMVIIGIVLILWIIASGFVLLRITERMITLQQEHQRLLYLHSLGETAASVAHEIRNPLNAIGITLQRLSAEYKPCEDLQGYDSLISSARSQITRIDSIVREFIAVAGNISPIRAEGETTQFLKNICEQFGQLCSQKGIAFNYEFSTDLPNAHWDWEKIKRAMENILKNALEVTQKNSIISLSAKLHTERITIEIFNQGKHIPKEMLGRIFEPFISDKASGTGIGLFYAFRIIEAHKGKISAANVQNGVKFAIEIPI